MFLICPHCGKSDCLNRHGPLINTKGQKRGHRFFCSNRWKREGCGRTFTVFLFHILPQRQITATDLWAFLEGIKRGLPKLHAMEKTSFSCSESSVYRLFRVFSHSQVHIRTLIFRVLKPPDRSTAFLPEMGTLEGLAGLPPQGLCPFAWFQYQFQRELLSQKKRKFSMD